jgi:predicted nucleotidyltransferase
MFHLQKIKRNFSICVFLSERWLKKVFKGSLPKYFDIRINIWSDQMNNDKLLFIAKEKAKQILAHSPKVQAFSITGSISIGQADKASDIDMCVYYNDDIPQEMRNMELQEVERTTGGIIQSSSNKTLVVIHNIPGIKCEVVHSHQADTEPVIIKVHKEHNTDLINHLVVTGTGASFTYFRV